MMNTYKNKIHRREEKKDNENERMNDDMMMVVVVNGEKKYKIAALRIAPATACGAAFLHFDWKERTLPVPGCCNSFETNVIGTSFCKWKRAWHRNTPGRIPTP